mmetsp:Transcript_10129/g.22792  ORF Transcript_10129/g.22792 Transcript_10129/m.22792 type:complete len:740 (+) Transcript_10129:179-2398(+)
MASETLVAATSTRRCSPPARPPQARTVVPHFAVARAPSLRSGSPYIRLAGDVAPGAGSPSLSGRDARSSPVSVRTEVMGSPPPQPTRHTLGVTNKVSLCRAPAWRSARMHSASSGMSVVAQPASSPSPPHPPAVPLIAGGHGSLATLMMTGQESQVASQGCSVRTGSPVRHRCAPAPVARVATCPSHLLNGATSAATVSPPINGAPRQYAAVHKLQTEIVAVAAGPPEVAVATHNGAQDVIAEKAKPSIADMSKSSVLAALEKAKQAREDFLRAADANISLLEKAANQIDASGTPAATDGGDLPPTASAQVTAEASVMKKAASLPVLTTTSRGAPEEDAGGIKASPPQEVRRSTTPVLARRLDVHSVQVPVKPCDRFGQQRLQKQPALITWAQGGHTKGVTEPVPLASPTKSASYSVAVSSAGLLARAREAEKHAFENRQRYEAEKERLQKELLQARQTAAHASAALERLKRPDVGNLLAEQTDPGPHGRHFANGSHVPRISAGGLRESHGICDDAYRVETMEDMTPQVDKIALMHMNGNSVSVPPTERLSASPGRQLPTLFGSPSLEGLAPRGGHSCVVPAMRPSQMPTAPSAASTPSGGSRYGEKADMATPSGGGPLNTSTSLSPHSQPSSSSVCEGRNSSPRSWRKVSTGSFLISGARLSLGSSGEAEDGKPDAEAEAPLQSQGSGDCGSAGADLSVPLSSTQVAASVDVFKDEESRRLLKEELEKLRAWYKTRAL